MKKESTNKPPTQEFRVVITGIRVPPEAVHRINRAVQKAVLTEVASMDLGGVGAKFMGNGGGTQGIELIAEAKGVNK
jgi:hypothetical protein